MGHTSNFSKYWVIFSLGTLPFLNACSKQEDAEPIASMNGVTDKSNQTLSTVDVGYPLSYNWTNALPGTGPLPAGMATKARIEFRIGSQLVLVAEDVPVTYSGISSGLYNWTTNVNYNIPVAISPFVPNTFAVKVIGVDGALIWDNGFVYQYQDNVDVTKSTPVVQRRTGIIAAPSTPLGYSTSFPVSWDTSLFSSSAFLRVYLVSVSSGTTYDVGTYSSGSSFPNPADGRGYFNNTGSQIQNIHTVPDGIYKIRLANTSVSNGYLNPTSYLSSPTFIDSGAYTITINN